MKRKKENKKRENRRGIRGLRWRRWWGISHPPKCRATNTRRFLATPVPPLRLACLAFFLFLFLLSCYQPNFCLCRLPLSIFIPTTDSPAAWRPSSCCLSRLCCNHSPGSTLDPFCVSRPAPLFTTILLIVISFFGPSRLSDCFFHFLIRRLSSSPCVLVLGGFL